MTSKLSIQDMIDDAMHDKTSNKSKKRDELKKEANPLKIKLNSFEKAASPGTKYGDASPGGDYTEDGGDS